MSQHQQHDYTLHKKCDSRVKRLGLPHPGARQLDVAALLGEDLLGLTRRVDPDRHRPGRVRGLDGESGRVTNKTSPLKKPRTACSDSSNFCPSSVCPPPIAFTSSSSWCPKLIFGVHFGHPKPKRKAKKTLHTCHELKERGICAHSQLPIIFLVGAAQSEILLLPPPQKNGGSVLQEEAERRLDGPSHVQHQGWLQFTIVW